MRIKQLSLVITFSSTTQAMSAEKFCMEHGIPGRIIPVPREITAGCGLAWKSLPEEKTRIVAELEAAGIQWASMHVIEI